MDYEWHETASTLQPLQSKTVKTLKIGINQSECHLLNLALSLARIILVDIQRHSPDHFLTLISQTWFTTPAQYELEQATHQEKIAQVHDKLTKYNELSVKLD